MLLHVSYLTSGYCKLCYYVNLWLTLTGKFCHNIYRYLVYYKPWILMNRAVGSWPWPTYVRRKQAWCMKPLMFSFETGGTGPHYIWLVFISLKFVFPLLYVIMNTRGPSTWVFEVVWANCFSFLGACYTINFKRKYKDTAAFLLPHGKLAWKSLDLLHHRVQQINAEVYS